MSQISNSTTSDNNSNSKNDYIKQHEDHLQQGITVSAPIAAVSGSISGIIARTVMAPLDIIKIRLQLQYVKKNHFKQENQKVKYRGIIGTFTAIVKNEGFFSLWKGNVPASIMYAIYGSSQFTSYSVFNKLFSDLEDKTDVKLSASVHSLMTGSAAGSLSMFISYPFDVLRTRFASNESQSTLKLFHTISEIYRKEGYLAFYGGINPALLSVTLSTGIMFSTYEVLRDFARNEEISFIEPTCGFLAGAFSKLCIFPLDVIRKRLQLAHDAKITPFTMFFSILKYEGFLGLFHGLTPALLKSGPTSAISLWVYEYFVNYLSRKASYKLE
ncbi:hypothetical protein PACTADRAFT_34651 [Pachysolen tannophilus NRRL Y-2460]|uniref:Mitochondrial thiamine pyrophosphate carrier 1 n=1 Tax=Pachysolen tannophilus NRRL Y-2460 TaxID=669874 RepID=A0A1E4TT24_PACTA|nr:hypothetical protein PACTADRAFT_34651 [Pachysolen tannophilus NRRL Y-2460]